MVLCINRVIFLKAASLTLLAVNGVCAYSEEPSLEDAMGAPAGDLAQGYLSSKYMLEKVLPYAEMGVVGTIHVAGETITARNASKYKKQYKKRLNTYTKAMRQRGSISLAGNYRGEATEPCSRVGSSWIGFIQSGEASAIEIIQDGADASLNISVAHEGKTHTLRNDAAVVEGSIALVDQMNSDYYFLGSMMNQKITIHPDVRVLSGWPDWASPPKQEDILGCAVELIPLAQDLR